MLPKASQMFYLAALLPPPQRIIVFLFLRWQFLYVQMTLNPHEPTTSASQLYETRAKNESESFVCMFVCFRKALLSPAWPESF